MRLFIGINFAEQVKEYLANQQQMIKLASSKGNYTLFDNFHLTLRFLGEVNGGKIRELEDILDIVSSRHQSFKIRIGRLNSFNRYNKHIVFTEVIAGIEELKALQRDLEGELIETGFLEQKQSFKPHITLAREVVFNEVSVLKTVGEYDDDIKVTEIVLFESKRNKLGKLEYLPLYETKLID